MKETIEFKKDLIFKNNIYEITEIDLEHDYRVLDGLIEGEFTLIGKYKITEVSIKEESFHFDVPFTIAISDRIDKSSVNLEIKDFTYNYLDDILKTKIQLSMEYTEIEHDENNINESIEEFITEKINEKENSQESNDINMIKDINKEQATEEMPAKESIDNTTEINKITELSSHFNSEEYATYKIHIVNENDTITSICNKYQISEKILKDTNKIENINISDRIIIPIIKKDE